MSNHIQQTVKGAGIMDYRKIITLKPGKRGDEACIRGLRITVHDILCRLVSGMTIQEILEEFPELNPEDILACLEYAAGDGLKGEK